MNIGISELDLVEGFLEGYSAPFHASHSDFFGSYALEVPMSQGRPDLVLGKTSDQHGDHAKCVDLGQLLRKPKYSSVIGNLSFRRFTEGDYLSETLGIRQAEMARILCELSEIGVVRRKSDKYMLSEESNLRSRALWAVEFKLTDWKRALYQAIRYRSSAQRVTVVMPAQSLPPRSKVLGVSARFNIGLSSYDTESGSLKTVVRTKTMNPYSMSNYYYGLGQFMELSGCA